MKRTITTMALTAVLLLNLLPEALAEPPDGTDGYGCQPGTEYAQESLGVDTTLDDGDSTHLETWRWISFDDFVDFLAARYGWDKATATARATLTFEFCDHNNNDYVCLTEQHNPNDASGSANYWLVEDDHRFGG